jgi:rapamycin-insensitive companion of mTOR
MAKDHTKWNYDALLEVVEGPLLNPKRMEEVVKVSRFMKRVMSFFHPFNHRFGDLPRKVGKVCHPRLGRHSPSVRVMPDG